MSRGFHRENYKVLLLFLGLGMVLGIVYLFLLPPWQHYDEPNHFEKMWLQYHLSEDQNFNQEYKQFRIDVVRSMIENNFFGEKNSSQSVDDTDQNIQIPGYTQEDEPPFYYLFASIPMRLFPLQKIENQLYSARFVSLLFYLLTIIAVWGTVNELTDSKLILIASLILVTMIPSFVELMTAVNNDSAAVMIVSFAVWGNIRLIKRGVSWATFLWVLVTMVMSYFAKSTAIVAIPVGILGIYLAIFRKRHAISYGLLAGFFVLILILSFKFDDPAKWYRSILQEEPIRVENNNAVHGQYTMMIDTGKEISPPWASPVFQPIPSETVQSLRGKYVSFGVWMWSDKKVTIRTPLVSTNSEQKYKTVNLTKEPVFVSFVVFVPGNTSRMWITIEPMKYGQKLNSRIYYDGFVLAEGRRPRNKAPVFNDDYGASGIWGREPFVNSIRNSSFEVPGLRVRSQIDKILASYIPDNMLPTTILNSLLDVEIAKVFYRFVAIRLFKTFWATFSWGHVGLVGNWGYPLIGLFTLFSGLGFAVFLIKERSNMDWDVFILFIVIILLVGFGALTRGAVFLGEPKLYFPVGRYIYPAIVPVVILLSIGWIAFSYPLTMFVQYFKGIKYSTFDSIFFDFVNTWWNIQITILFLLFFFMNIWSLYSIAIFYKFI